MENLELSNAEWWVRFFTSVRTVSALLVAIGVAGEFLGDWLSEPYQKRIDDTRAGLIASANDRAAASELALAKLRTPRTLTDEQSIALTIAMKKFAGVPFDFSLQPNSETINFMVRLGGILQSAGMKWMPFGAPNTPVFTQPGFPAAGIVAFAGLGVQYDASKEADWEAPAATLLAALRSFGYATVGVKVIDGTVNAAAIHIYICEKPV